MSTVYALAGIAGVFGIIVFAIWLLVRNARNQGRSEQEAETSRRMVELSEKQGAVVAEHREPADAAGRLRRGDF